MLGKEVLYTCPEKDELPQDGSVKIRSLACSVAISVLRTQVMGEIEVVNSLQVVIPQDSKTARKHFNFPHSVVSRTNTSGKEQ